MLPKPHISRPYPIFLQAKFSLQAVNCWLLLQFLESIPRAICSLRLCFGPLLTVVQLSGNSRKRVVQSSAELPPVDTITSQLLMLSPYTFHFSLGPCPTLSFPPTSVGSLLTLSEPWNWLKAHCGWRIATYWIQWAIDQVAESLVH